MIARSARSTAASAARRLASLLKHVDRAVDHSLGPETVAERVRRYVGEHDAPPDDRTAFARMCTVVFAQGIGYEVVLRKGEALNAAFDGFDPTAVASFDDARVATILEAPIVRNQTKVRACIENARRWCALAQTHGTYLSRVAPAAAADDPVSGWPALAATLQGDFVQLGESTARQTLKRWGFFTAFAHPGARRLIERLGCANLDGDGPAAQRLIGAVAHRVGRDPYAVEAVLALFAGTGPCKKIPDCDACALADRCPSASTTS